MPSDYTLSNTDAANAATFNKLFGDINVRLKSLEKAESAINQASDELVQLGLAKINPAVEEALAVLDNVSQLSNLFEARSTSEVEIATGVTEFIIEPEDRSHFAAPKFLVFYVTGQLDTWMAGQTQSWNKETGQLLVDITTVKGDGTFSDWGVAPVAIMPDAGPTLDAYTKTETDAEVAQAKADVKSELLGGVGEAFDTLKELADARGVNVDAIAALTATVGQKADSDALKALAYKDKIIGSDINPKTITADKFAENILNTGTDLNTVIQNGFYRLVGSHVNWPDGGANWGQLVVSRNSDTIFQMLSYYHNGDVYVRSGYGIGGTPVFTAWKKISDQPGLNLLATAEANNSSSVVFQSHIDDTYDQYIVECIGVVPVLNNETFMMRTSSDGGVSYDAGPSDYSHVFLRLMDGSTSNTVYADSGDTAADLGTALGNTAGEHVNSSIKIYNPAGTSLRKTMQYDSVMVRENGETQRATGMCTRESTAAINALQFLFKNGNIASGKFKLYGVR